MKIKHIIQTLIISAFCTAFIMHLYTGKYGIKNHHELYLEVESKKKQQQELNAQITSLENDIHRWQTDPLVKEKMVREDLLYSYTNEYVYLVPKATT